GTSVLEWLAAGDVVEMVMAVDQELDGLVGDLFDLGDIVLSTGRPPVGDGIGRDDAVPGNNEHRLMIAVAEDVNVVGAFDLGGLDLRPLLLLRQRSCCKSNRDQGGRHSCKTNPQHVIPPFASRAANSL